MAVRCVRIPTVLWLARAEGNDAPDRIVRRHADGHAISRNYLDAKAAHSAAELGEDLVTRITLHAVQSAAVNCHDGSLHVNKIVLAQTASNPFSLDNYCATSIRSCHGITQFSAALEGPHGFFHLLRH